jgi:DNA-binding transcriptional LysR family regulator
MSSPAVTRAVLALEGRMYVRPLNRTTRTVRLTEAEARFLEDGLRILMGLDTAEEVVTGAHGILRGELRITALMLLGRLYVTLMLGDTPNIYLEVSCQTLSLDPSASLIGEGLDVSVRIGVLPDSLMTVIQVGSVRWVTFAAPGHL